MGLWVPRSAQRNVRLRNLGSCEPVVVRGARSARHQAVLLGRDEIGVAVRQRGQGDPRERACHGRAGYAGNSQSLALSVGAAHRVPSHPETSRGALAHVARRTNDRATMVVDRTLRRPSLRVAGRGGAGAPDRRCGAHADDLGRPDRCLALGRSRLIDDRLADAEARPGIRAHLHDRVQALGSPIGGNGRRRSLCAPGRAAHRL